jgi:putative ABC transport system ATP-binding protein
VSALVLDDLCVSFTDGDEQIAALDHVSLTVGGGELVAIVGASGSGKSSLLAVAGALRSPDRGTVTIGDVDITSAKPSGRAALRRTKIGFVFQASNLFQALTALDQLTYMARIAGKSSRDARPEASRLLDVVGLGLKANRRPGELSGGERQRVGIARALITEPEVLLVDEPTSALDHDNARGVVTLLRDLTHERRIATVMVTHDLSVTDLADRVVTMRDGRLGDTTDRGIRLDGRAG